VLKRIRHLHISLAAKCQLLFGAAVVLIIAAALFVPWQRMEQLTAQLNERSARTLVEYAIDAHVADERASEANATTKPTSPGVVHVTPTTTQPVGGAEPVPPPRLLLVGTKHDDPALTRCERRAIRNLDERRSGNPVTDEYERPDGTIGFRFARTDASCIKCHIPDSPAAVVATTQRAETDAKLVGLVVVDIPSQIETRQKLLNRVFILTAGLLAGTLAIIVFYLITTRLILQPVRVLQTTAEKVSEGNLDIRSDISTGDEFQQLSETFNVMLANLKQSADALRAVNKSLDIKLGQLAESNVALYEANRLKSEFLANVSHELRTPLNSILGFADLLKDAAAEDPKSTRYVQNILSSGRNLLDLINDLLDLAKIEAGRMEIRSEPLSLGDLFEGLISVLKPLTEQKQLNIVAGVTPDVPIIETDPAKLQQVLYNFLSNAIKFSPAGSRIDLRAERDVSDEGNGHSGSGSLGGVRVSVTDRGPGIPGEHHDLIFEKFRQIDASHTRGHGGTGLGLAISKELVTLLGGTIGVDSTPGRGSTFWIVLPLKNAAGTQDLRERLVLSP
jgi:signal transduction histidine kinase